MSTRECDVCSYITYYSKGFLLKKKIFFTTLNLLTHEIQSLSPLSKSTSTALLYTAILMLYHEDLFRNARAKFTGIKYNIIMLYKMFVRPPVRNIKFCILFLYYVAGAQRVVDLAI